MKGACRAPGWGEGCPALVWAEYPGKDIRAPTTAVLVIRARGSIHKTLGLGDAPQ